MNNQMKYGIAGLLIGAVAVWFFTNANFSDNRFSMMGNSNYNSNYNRVISSNIDSHFIEQMIPHHEDAITMSKLALTKAKKPEVKQLAQRIIDSQSREIDQMKSWYKDWFGKEVPAGSDEDDSPGMMGRSGRMHGGMMGDSSDVAGLEQAADFDKAFLEEMIPHHQMAVMMTTMLKNGTNRPEMAKLADEIITAQTTEINQMRGWLKSW